MSEKDFEISRRKALAGIGVVGVASAGAGLGTTAYFSDQEEIEDNTITAGEFGLTVDPGNHLIDQDGESQDVKWPTEESDAFSGGSIYIYDAKPGDEFKFCWDVTVENNPGYAMVTADGVEHLDGSETDAGVDANDLYDTDELETLENNVGARMAVYEEYDRETQLWEDEFDDLGDLLDNLENGVNIASDEENPLQIEPGETVIVCIYLDISTNVGNEIQGAETSWDLSFYAEQSRHNDEFGED